VHQGRRLERLAGLFLGEFLRRQLAQLLVYQRQELSRGVGIASFDGGQNAGNFVHRRHRKVFLSPAKIADEYTVIAAGPPRLFAIRKPICPLRWCAPVKPMTWFRFSGAKPS
jgi:hypothetical protein